VCAPGQTLALALREPALAEREVMSQILKSLQARNGQSTGRLHVETTAGGLDRRDFEALLAALARGGLLTIGEDEFESEGERIRYRRAFLTRAGRAAGEEELLALSLVDAPRAAPRKRRARRSGAAGRSAAGKGAATTGRRPRSREATARAQKGGDGGEPEPGLVEAIKTWRLSVARRRRMPAFKVLNDRTVDALASAKPADEEALLGVRGIGPTLARKYGAELIDLIARQRT
jgi:DNA topoisomerase-3